MDSDQSAWVTWRSTDGGDTWTEDREHAVFPGALQAITPGGAGLVAFGSTFSGVTPYDSLPVDSPDGIEWQATGASLANSAVLATAALGDRIVAVGMAWPSPEDLVFEPAAWYSDDGGETWASGNLPGTGAEESIFDVTAFQGGLVAIGYGEAAVSWTTVDGATWERFEVASSARSMAIGAVDDGLVAVGNRASSAGSIGQGSTWTSGDARAWFDGPALGDGSVAFSAVAGNADLVLAGGRCQAASCATVLWRGEVIR
jgi:hypothetical protein